MFIFFRQGLEKSRLMPIAPLLNAHSAIKYELLVVGVGNDHLRMKNSIIVLFFAFRHNGQYTIKR
jgi:hypothetical protein